MISVTKRVAVPPFKLKVSPSGSYRRAASIWTPPRAQNGHSWVKIKVSGPLSGESVRSSFEGVCLDSRHPDQLAHVEGDIWTALRDTTSGDSGDSGDSADSRDSGDEFQKTLPRASFWSNTPTLSLKSSKKTKKNTECCKKTMIFT